jgi:hypothetical protein
MRTATTLAALTVASLLVLALVLVRSSSGSGEPTEVTVADRTVEAPNHPQ